MSNFTFGSLFAGIGGLDLGLERGGMRCAWQCEIDDYAQKVLANHWPNTPRFRDVRECGKHNLAPVDLIAGGFPCQPHSLAGERKASSDERNLWPEFYRIIRELKPRWVVAENVLGLLNSEGGAFFCGILRDLAKAGYDARWQVLSAAQFGAPHLRERVFIVAHTTSTRQQKRQDTAWSSSPVAHICRFGSNTWRTEPEGQCRQTNTHGISASPVADTNGVQPQRRGIFRDMGSETPESQRSEEEWQRLWDASHDCSTDVAHASSQRREEWDASPCNAEQGQHPRRVETRRGAWAVESCLGELFDGVSTGLVRHRWPAGPRQEQHEWEPLRVVTERVPNRTKMLKGLGNAVVPALAEYIGRCIMAAEAEMAGVA